MTGRQVLNYHDVLLYESDVALFAARQWLNDSALCFYLQYVYHSRCLAAGGARGEEVLVVDPAVVSCLLWQCDEEDEYEELARGLDLARKRLVLVPVNDSASLGGASSHWSLLVFDAERQTFEHFDSSAGHNTEAAERVAHELQALVRVAAQKPRDGSDPVVAHVRDAPQQTNGYDCGVYVLLVAEYVCRAHLGDALPPMVEYVTPERATSLRLEIPGIVRRLQLAAQ